jgi:hypothetical protein
MIGRMTYLRAAFPREWENKASIAVEIHLAVLLGCHLCLLCRLCSEPSPDYLIWHQHNKYYPESVPECHQLLICASAIGAYFNQMMNIASQVPRKRNVRMIVTT